MRRLPVIGLSALLVACGGDGGGRGTARESRGEEQAMASIEGSVLYRERIMLPPGAELEVQLEDVSRADAPAEIVAGVKMALEGGPPYPFAVDYDPALIDERMRYGLRATIRRGDRLLFTTTEYIDPFAASPLQVLVRAVPAPVRAAGPALEGTTWLLATLGGEAAAAGAGGRQVDLLFLPEQGTAAGFSGCNRYSGAYARKGNGVHGSPLSIGPAAGTMMACPEGMELERAFLDMLGKVSAYRVVSGTLVLLDGGGGELATFVPQQEDRR